MQIEYLADHPDLVDSVTRHTYSEWSHLYQAAGLSLDDYRSVIESRCTKTGIPFTLVAHHDGEFAGSVSVKTEESSTIPGLSPWLGGLLVSDNWRGHGVGHQLLTRAEVISSSLGISTMYLSCAADLAPFYNRYGWQFMQSADLFGDSVLVLQKRIA